MFGATLSTVCGSAVPLETVVPDETTLDAEILVLLVSVEGGFEDASEQPVSAKPKANKIVADRMAIDVFFIPILPLRNGIVPHILFFERLHHLVLLVNLIINSPTVRFQNSTNLG